MKGFLKILGSKTVIGGAGAILTWLSTMPVIDITHVVGGASALLGIIGLRQAVEKNGPAKKE